MQSLFQEVEIAAWLEDETLPPVQPIVYNPSAEVERSTDINIVSYRLPLPTMFMDRPEIPPFKVGDMVVFSAFVPESITRELSVSPDTPLLVWEVHYDADTIVEVPMNPRGKDLVTCPEEDIVIAIHVLTQRWIVAPLVAFCHTSEEYSRKQHLLND